MLDRVEMLGHKLVNWIGGIEERHGHGHVIFWGERKTNLEGRLGVPFYSGKLTLVLVDHSKNKQRSRPSHIPGV